jgi:hypothetical protein
LLRKIDGVDDAIDAIDEFPWRLRQLKVRALDLNAVDDDNAPEQTGEIQGGRCAFRTSPLNCASPMRMPSATTTGRRPSDQRSDPISVGRPVYCSLTRASNGRSAIGSYKARRHEQHGEGQEDDQQQAPQDTPQPASRAGSGMFRLGHAGALVGGPACWRVGVDILTHCGYLSVVARSGGVSNHG